MNVLAILQVSNMGGLEQATYRTMRTLHACYGAEFRVVSATPFGIGAEVLRRFDREAKDFPHRGYLGWRDLPHLSKHLMRVGAECGTIWVSGTPANALAAVQKAKKHRRRPRVVLSHHHHHFEGRNSGLRWLAFYAGLCRGTDSIVYPTRFTRTEALRIAPWLGDRARVIHHGVEVHRMDEASRRRAQLEARERLGLPASAWIVGNAGWLIDRKRFDVFLKTAQAVRRRVKDAYFVICGSGSQEAELKSLASDLGLADAVRFTGWVKDLASQYQAWDVVLFNSDYDALGLTPLEAAGWGCLVVASVRNGGLDEFIEDGKNGFLLREHTPEHLAGIIAGLARDASAAHSLRVAAWDTLQADFDPRRNGVEYAEVLGL